MYGNAYNVSEESDSDTNCVENFKCLCSRLWGFLWEQSCACVVWELLACSEFTKVEGLCLHLNTMFSMVLGVEFSKRAKSGVMQFLPSSGQMWHTLHPTGSYAGVMSVREPRQLAIYAKESNLFVLDPQILETGHVLHSLEDPGITFTVDCVEDLSLIHI